MPSPINRWLVLAAVILAFIPIVIDMTILHVAVPSLTLALQASGTQILWIIDIYPLLMAGLLVPMGTLADRVGHRRMLLFGLAIFGAASVAAAFSPSAPFLIAARAAMALGGSMTMPSILAVIRQTFEDPQERGIALGLWGTVSSAGAAIGPLAGGFLLEHFWWGSVFLINVPVLLVVWPFVFFAVPRHGATGRGEWTIGQALILIAGLMATIYALKAGATGRQSPFLVMVLLLGGLGLLAAFVRMQLRAVSPMLDLGLFRKPAIAVGIAMALVVSGALAGAELTLAQELQFVIGKTPLQAGLLLLPLVIASAIGGPFAGFLVSRLGLRAVASVAMGIASASLVGLALSDLHHVGIAVLGSLVALGLALGIGMTASSIAVMSSVTPEKAGAAGALEATGYELGTGLGITFFGVILAAVYRRAISIPPDIAVDLPATASLSIGETFVAAEALDPVAREALLNAGRDAFGAAHASLLLIAALLIAALTLAVFVALRNFHDETRAAH